MLPESLTGSNAGQRRCNETADLVWQEASKGTLAETIDGKIKQNRTIEPWNYHMRNEKEPISTVDNNKNNDNNHNTPPRANLNETKI